MRNLLFSLIALAIAATFLQLGCRRDENEGFCSNKGVILGVDPRLCGGCCGGWFVEIAGDTFNILALPEAFAQGLDPEEFPLPVDLDWKHVIGPCQGTMIEVECIKRR